MAATNPDGSDVTIIGHRGCAGQYPENTVLAIERSAPHVDAVELDVRRCGSGELVVFHDERLGRLTDASGVVGETAWETLRDLTVLGTSQPIPRLSTALDAVPGDTGVIIDIKERGLAADLWSVAERADTDVCYASAVPDALRAIRAASEDADRALIVSGPAGRPIRTAATLGCVAIHPRYEVVFGTDFVGAAHDAGLTVNVWTIARAAPVADLVRARVDGLIVDAPDLVDFDGERPVEP